ncbi:hypothetical protein ZYGR_0H03580 [Zygosaccharomyces rouxii]|uniref:ZYRO0B12276p n=2 Tax=Zygosaccharomyces rouxii TaxID=4956 RepID=C5DRY3_ZYGRC|nr:uncharacterized protein ZYRO0B12276g [Zygosaccharomyces rouxii]KAH9199926.1 hypothetical protein LQ764DRAFT_234520 [Zygosaccharomyces rouxii]GAV47514.1 hypothetical protein ZYGR_0H03580 [Zygosaccharomyces rouxii]CAR26544.1 ZYRO0B12276p [Zygosaccharomyces rouxii]
MAGHSHRSSFKNGHKGFKSKHSSKGAIKRLNKGKVEKDAKSGRPVKGVSKLQRKNLARQKREQKILDSSEIRKLFEGPHGAQKIITVIPLCNDIDPEEIVSKLISISDENLVNTNGIRNFYIKKFKSHLKFIVPDMSNFIQILDCAKISDFCVFGLSGTSEIDPQFGEQILRALESQGIGSQLGVVTNLSQVHPKEKFQLDVKQSLESYFKHFFPNQEKIFNLEKDSESLNAIRTLCQKFPQGVSWRDQRGYLVADKMDFIQRDEQFGELVVEGTVRGAGFNANRLIHIPEFGDFQVSKIEKCKDSERKSRSNNNIKKDDELDLELNNVFESNDNRDGLEPYAPKEIELQDDEDFRYDELETARYDDHGFLPSRDQGPSKAKVLPKGTSDYQARWYLDDIVDVGEDEEVDERISEDEEMDQDNMDEEEEEEEELNEPLVDEDGAEDDDFMDLDPEQEEQQLQQFRAKEKEDLEFPDEIELHPNESAIESLRKYRGVKNLGNCNWDVDERDPDKPSVWKRLLRISNYKNTRNRIAKENKAEIQVIAGDVVRIYIKFPNDQLTKIQDPNQTLFAVYGLLPHEHKNAVVNFTMQRWEEYDKPVPSETPLVVQYGMRRYTIQPLFSAASNSNNNVHKNDRFLQPDTLSIATCIAPVDFTQCPAIFFRPSAQDPKGLELMAQGSFVNTDFTRIITSRIILTGHPFRFHRSFVTVRYMFFRPQDVEWFKSIPLFTKSGRSGFIRESLGTHGYYKASFDGKLSAEDVVAMSLYKREWPRTSQLWTTTY